MAVNGIDTIGTAQAAAAAATTTPRTNQLGQDAFIKLLTAQLQFQDPSQPVQGTEFLTELAQFSQVQGLTQLNTTFSQLLQLQQLSQGAQLIGRTVEYVQAGAAGTQKGVVQEVTLQNGSAQLMVNGTAVDFSQLRGVTS